MQSTENEMAGQGGTRTNLARFEVPDLSHQDNVRVLPQERAEAKGERQTDISLGLHLIHTGKLVLHRILDCENILLRAPDFVEGRIKGRGLAAARRPRDKNKPVRFTDLFSENLQIVRSFEPCSEEDLRQIEDQIAGSITRLWALQA